MISAEARFITLCVREPERRADDALRRTAGTVQNWPAVAEIAERHRVMAYVYQASERAGAAVPQATLSKLRSAWLASVAQTMALDQELERAAGALTGAGIGAMVLKGPALARSLYPQPTQRPYGDLDLLVPRRQERAAARALERTGYMRIADELRDRWRGHDEHQHGPGEFHLVFHSPNGRTAVELHADPLQLGLLPACEKERWRRALPLPGRPEVLMLAPEDQLVTLAVHAHKHGFNRLIWLKDLDLLLRRNAERLDWDLAQQVAAAEGVQASVWYALVLTARLLGTRLPNDMLDGLRPAAPVQALYRYAWPYNEIADLRGQMRRRAVQFDPSQSWRGMLPGLLFMGRRRDRVRAIARLLSNGRSLPLG